ncbi:hypothetical protein Tco_0877818 [Tanacetum coccineum]|uniref:Uncharacterized protein n=1 Tax=Tanacetum coccineum TaxID=301880 RepID=A0ABQ5BZ52_9ASTR
MRMPPFYRRKMNKTTRCRGEKIYLTSSRREEKEKSTDRTHHEDWNKVLNTDFMNSSDVLLQEYAKIHPHDEKRSPQALKSVKRVDCITEEFEKWGNISFKRISYSSSSSSFIHRKIKIEMSDDGIRYEVHKISRLLSMPETPHT